MIDITEIDEFIVTNFIFHRYEILLDENEIIIELDSKSDRNKLIEYLESEFSDLYEIIPDAYDELFLIIRFKNNIEYYPDELINNTELLISELKEYQKYDY